MQKRTKFELDSCNMEKPPFWEDERYNTEEYNNQIKEYGFADYELWNLDSTILEFIIPRLIRFKEITHSYPSKFEEPEEWEKVIEEIIEGLKYGLKMYMTEEERKKFRKAGLLLLKYFSDLWD